MAFAKVFVLVKEDLKNHENALDFLDDAMGFQAAHNNENADDISLDDLDDFPIQDQKVVAKEMNLINNNGDDFLKDLEPIQNIQPHQEL